MDDRRKLEEIVERGDPVEWLNVLKHEATRANNAEAAVEHWRSELADSQARERQLAEAIRSVPWNTTDPSRDASPVIVERQAWDALQTLAARIARSALLATGESSGSARAGLVDVSDRPGAPQVSGPETEGR